MASKGILIGHNTAARPDGVRCSKSAQLQHEYI